VKDKHLKTTHSFYLFN